MYLRNYCGKIEDLSGTLKHVLAFINGHNLNIYQVVISGQVRNAVNRTWLMYINIYAINKINL